MISPEGREKLLERIDRFALFDPAAYHDLNPDARSVPAREHFVDHGMWAHVPFTRDHGIACLLGSLSKEPFPRSYPLSTEEIAEVLGRSRDLDVGVYANSQGNFFMREIAGLVVAGLQTIGVRASLRDEQTSLEHRPPVSIFVAPHEFFLLGRGVEWFKEDIVTRSFMLSTEQMQTPWFRSSLPYVLLSRAVIDINYQTHRLFEMVGIPSLFYFPGYSAGERADETALPDHALARALPRGAKHYDTSQDVWTDRPLDVVFLGAESPVREDFLAHNAGFFARLSCFINYLRLSGVRTGPLSPEPQEARPALNRYLGRRAKIVLNLHQGEIGYFEWHRMVMQGMWNKALVVSDPCLPHPVFKPGIHYLEETPRRIPKLIDWLLHSPDGRLAAARIRNAAYAALVEQASVRRMSLTLARFLADHRS
jgi:hypothetical protein